ncbi:BnaCnng28240D [Brassica napus]|uniref:BnaCnng28240D protein n=1 Tax=Brassica napus TaxID=3708 RepID=A0A078IUJ5_BRANA|nr:BnaCnng28240D [Brassica napus]
MLEADFISYLETCETMGSATTICSEKTGTLTNSHMTIVKSCICMNL